MVVVPISRLYISQVWKVVLRRNAFKTEARREAGEFLVCSGCGDHPPFASKPPGVFEENGYLTGIENV